MMVVTDCVPGSCSGSEPIVESSCANISVIVSAGTCTGVSLVQGSSSGTVAVLIVDRLSGASYSRVVSGIAGSHIARTGVRWQVVVIVVVFLSGETAGTSHQRSVTAASPVPESTTWVTSGVVVCWRWTVLLVCSVVAPHGNFQQRRDEEEQAASC